MALVEAARPARVLSQSEARSARPSSARGRADEHASFVSRLALGGGRVRLGRLDAGRSTASAAPSRRGDGDRKRRTRAKTRARAGPACAFGDGETRRVVVRAG